MTTAEPVTFSDLQSIENAADPIRDHFDRSARTELPHVFGSTVCRAEHFLLPLFNYWCGELKQPPRMHRKVWEFAFILQTLFELDMLQQGRRGLGFGIGTEPLPSYFASLGIDVVATDLEPEAAREAGWTESNQHAASTEALFEKDLVDRAAFDAHVTFQEVDMNAIPDTLLDFDFCWSTCSCEHLGNLDNGLVFMADSLATLKSGGVAVHTTEFNLTSNDETVDEGGTVLYRRQDIETLEAVLKLRGHRVLPINYYRGCTEIDRYVDVPPYGEDPHLKLRLWEYDSTSIGVVAIKA